MALGPQAPKAQRPDQRGGKTPRNGRVHSHGTDAHRGHGAVARPQILRAQSRPSDDNKTSGIAGWPSRDKGRLKRPPVGRNTTMSRAEVLTRKRSTTGSLGIACRQRPRTPTPAFQGCPAKARGTKPPGRAAILVFVTGAANSGTPAPGNNRRPGLTGPGFPGKRRKPAVRHAFAGSNAGSSYLMAARRDPRGGPHRRSTGRKRQRRRQQRAVPAEKLRLQGCHITHGQCGKLAGLDRARSLLGARPRDTFAHDDAHLGPNALPRKHSSVRVLTGKACKVACRSFQGKLSDITGASARSSQPARRYRPPREPHNNNGSPGHALEYRRNDLRHPPRHFLSRDCRSVHKRPHRSPFSSEPDPPQLLACSRRLRAPCSKPDTRRNHAPSRHQSGTKNPRSPRARQGPTRHFQGIVIISRKRCAFLKLPRTRSKTGSAPRRASTGTARESQGHRSRT